MPSEHGHAPASASARTRRHHRTAVLTVVNSAASAIALMMMMLRVVCIQAVSSGNEGSPCCRGGPPRGPWTVGRGGPGHVDMCPTVSDHLHSAHLHAGRSRFVNLVTCTQLCTVGTASPPNDRRVTFCLPYGTVPYSTVPPSTGTIQHCLPCPVRSSSGTVS